MKCKMSPASTKRKAPALLLRLFMDRIFSVVKFGPFFWVAQNFVRLRDFMELLIGTVGLFLRFALTSPADFIRM